MAFESPEVEYSPAVQPMDGAALLEPPDPYMDDAALLKLFEACKKEAMENRWQWEREWAHGLHYVNNNQWIFYHPAKRQWVDKRLHKWIPKPVTNKVSETLQAIRTNFSAINLAPKIRPTGNDPKSVAASEIADQLTPLIHEEHNMNQVMREADFWLISCGQALLFCSWDLDQRANRMFVPHEQCPECGTISKPQDIVAAGNVCPTCQNPQLQPAVGPDGQEQGEWIAFGKGKTVALSPFEYALPQNCTRFDEIPFIIRMRWRDKHWFDANRPDLVNKITWEKNSNNNSIQIFKSLAVASDVIQTSQSFSIGSGSGDTLSGITEYELWYKPTPTYPKGLVLRVIGDQAPMIMRLENESLPGPFPVADIEGNPLFPFFAAQYEHIGGRIYGRSAISPILQKQDQINQLDSLIQLIVQRTANPGWIIPEGAGIDRFSGEPGFVFKWNPLAVGGTNAKPERVKGEDIGNSLFVLRQQYLDDIENLTGAFDIIKGQKPTGIEAFSALQLLVERSQSRFTAVFQARGEMYRGWCSFALEMERLWGPEQRTYGVLGQYKGYTFKHFENAQLQGQIEVQIEDGSTMPKTALGKRAAIEQANQLRLLDPADPDQRYALLTSMGLSDLSPTLNIHVQAALQIQDEFEKWAQSPIGPPPLIVEPWHDAQVHWTERIKWLNSDKMRELLQTMPELKPIITMHLQQLQMIMMPSIPIDQAPAPGGGGGMAMTNSNKNSGSTSGLPSGNAQTGPNVGPT